MNMTNRTNHFSALVAGFVLCSLANSAQSGEINTGYFGDVAIKGYDTVAYFTMDEAVKGSDDYSLEWLGTVWFFSSSKHQEMFASMALARCFQSQWPWRKSLAKSSPR